jgi:ParB family transcriptional regulator, chromosome partitioning protein
MKKRGLGRSLNAILSPPPKPTESADNVAALEKPLTSVADAAPDLMKELAVDQLQRGQFQPRRAMDQEALAELAVSIKSHGVLQPIIVRQLSGGQCEIIAGERRWRAAKLAGLATVPVVIKKVADDAAMAIGVIENIQRENLNPIEEATAFARLLHEFEMTHQEVAEAVGRSRAAVSNLLRLLNLTTSVQKLLEHGDMEMGHARALLPLAKDQQLKAAQYIVEQGLSVRETEAYVRKLQQGEPVAAAPSKKPTDPDVLKLQQSLSDRLHTKVAIKHGDEGRGKVVIHYRSLQELDEILGKV